MQHAFVPDVMHVEALAHQQAAVFHARQAVGSGSARALGRVGGHGLKFFIVLASGRITAAGRPGINQFFLKDS